MKPNAVYLGRQVYLGRHVLHRFCVTNDFPIPNQRFWMILGSRILSELFESKASFRPSCCCESMVFAGHGARSPASKHSHIFAMQESITMALWILYSRYSRYSRYSPCVWIPIMRWMTTSHFHIPCFDHVDISWHFFHCLRTWWMCNKTVAVQIHSNHNFDWLGTW